MREALRPKNLLRARPFSYGGSQCFDHETGKIRCIQMDAAVDADLKVGCEQAGGEGIDAVNVVQALVNGAPWWVLKILGRAMFSA